MQSSREIAKSAKSLICLLQSLVGRQVQIELRNDTYLLGTLQSVDINMNTELYDAHMWSIYAELSKDPPPAGNDEPFLITAEPNEELLLGQPKVDYMFIKGSRIRYFHLPEGVDMIECIETQLASFRRRQQPTERPFNWKSYRKKQKIEQLQLKLGESEQRQEEPDTTETSSVQGVEPECSQNQAQ